jgi:hypothetical protein
MVVKSKLYCLYFAFTIHILNKIQNTDFDLNPVTIIF